MSLRGCVKHIHAINQPGFLRTVLGRAVPATIRNLAGAAFRDALPLLDSPTQVAADASGGRLFICDSGNNRVVITNLRGHVLDFIGSTQGYADGPFHEAQLRRPAGMALDASGGCLFLADSENDAIRRADLVRRTVDTLHPPPAAPPRRSASWWSALMRLFDSSAAPKPWLPPPPPEAPESPSAPPGGRGQLAAPWHLALTPEGQLAVASRDYEQLWLVSPSSGVAKAVTAADTALRGSGAMPAAAAFWALAGVAGADGDTWPLPAQVGDGAYSADTSGHRVLVTTGGGCATASSLQLSGLGRLGLPAAWDLPAEPVRTDSPAAEGVPAGPKGMHGRVTARISIRPGRSLLCFHVALPPGAALAAPLEEGAIWRQARGSITELSSIQGALKGREVTWAQEWVDQLDASGWAAGASPDAVAELAAREGPGGGEREAELPPASETGLPIYALVEASTGTGEVILDAAIALDNKLQDKGTGGTPPEDGGGERMSCGRLRGAPLVCRLHARVRVDVSLDAPGERTRSIHLAL